MYRIAGIIKQCASQVGLGLTASPLVGDQSVKSDVDTQKSGGIEVKSD